MLAAMGRGTIALVGSGAVGSYYGGRLAAAGEEVRFLVRSGLEELRREGLTVESVNGDFHLAAPRVYATAEEIGPADLVVVAWKATSNRHFGEVLPPLVGEDTAILTLQNGLGNTERLAELFGGERVMGGLCFVCINRLRPGMIRHTAAGHIRIGEYRGGISVRLRELEVRMRRAGIEARAVDDLAHAQWVKLVWNVPFNGLTIVEGGIDTEALLAMPGGEDEVRALMAEVIEGAAVLGHEIPRPVIDQQVEVTRPMGPYRPSSMIDYVEGREVELEAIWEEPYRRAREAGAQLPAWKGLLERLRERLADRG